MKKANLNKIFSIIFILFLVLPFPCYFALSGLINNQNRENRELAPMPNVETELSLWPKQFEDFLNDHAAFRTPLMQLNAAINYKIFGSVNSETVLLGKDNWLFYKNVSDSRSLDDYQGINAYSDGQHQEILNGLILLRDNLAKHNIDFAVIIAPNKEKIYSQFMPDSVPVINEQGRAELLSQYINKTNEIKFLYPKKELLQAKESAQIYYKYDTHWNDVGALIASRELLKLTNSKEYPFSYDMITEAASAETMDLADLTSIYPFTTDDKRFEIPQYGDEVYTDLIESSQNDNYQKFSCKDSEGKLLMLRDSFGAKMEPFLAKSYDESVFVHLNIFNENTIKTEMPDIFVWEVAERHLDRLNDYLPRLILWSESL